MSLPILAAMRANSLLCAVLALIPPAPPPAPAEPFASKGASCAEDAARNAADSTAERNSAVRSKYGRDMVVCARKEAA